MDEKKPRMLLVDDNRDVRRAMERALTRFGFEIETADGVDAAIELLKTRVYDLVVTDLQMPAATEGFTLVDRVVALRPELAGRAVVVSGQNFEPHERAALAEVGYIVLSKSDPPRALGEFLQGLLVEKG